MDDRSHPWQITAHARSRGATLVSNDVRHFRRVEGLLVANWA